jgi:hypothetical protein
MSLCVVSKNTSKNTSKKASEKQISLLSSFCLFEPACVYTFLIPIWNEIYLINFLLKKIYENKNEIISRLFIIDRGA